MFPERTWTSGQGSRSLMRRMKLVMNFKPALDSPSHFEVSIHRQAVVVDLIVVVVVVVGILVNNTSVVAS